MDFEINIANLTRDELEEECHHLRLKCKQLLSASEDDAQRIHELKRNLEVSTATELYLSQELEQLTLNAEQKTNNSKLETEHEELRRKHHELTNDLAALQDNFNALAEENIIIRSKLESFNEEKEKNGNNDSETYVDRLNDRLNLLEQENMELLQKIDEQHADRMHKTMAIAEKDRRIEIILDEMSCLKENMRYMREELKEKTRLLESAQEQVFEANTKINVLMSSSDNKDRKGNSLFAEVDDQRQAMRQLLASQKKSFQEMKKLYNDSEYEIRRLKRENGAMQTELRACSSIFCKADRTYQEKLYNRIQLLYSHNEQLERKIKWMQQQLKDLASDRDVLWLDSMFEFCKRESDDLKEKLHSLLLKNACLEEQLRNVEQDMVRWRFEALKSRCLIIDRENLLTEHKIAFTPKNDVEFTITSKQEEMARPRIVPAETLNLNPTNPETTQTIETVKENDQTLQQEDIKQQPIESKNSNESIIVLLDDSVVCNKENDDALMACKMESNSSIEVGTIIAESPQKSTPTATFKSEVHTREILKEISPRIQIKSVETINQHVDDHMKQQQSPTNNLPSILSKQRDVVNLNADKCVTFDTKGPTIHNLSAAADSPIDEARPSDSKEEKLIVKEESNSKVTIKTMRTKSNVIVRHVVVGRKPK